MLAQAILGPGAHGKHLQLLRSAGLAIASSGHGIPGGSRDLVIILGGDGTIHRFLPDLIRSRLPVLVLPCGSGNDLAHALRIESMQVGVELAREFARGNARISQIDLGIVADSSGRETPFCCTGGVGLDAVAAQFANRLPRWIHAHGGYLLGATRALFANPCLRLKITANTGFATESQCSIFSFANTPSFGGGLPIAPSAELNDGHLDCVWVDATSRSRLAKATISLLKGKHLQLQEVHSMRADGLRIDSDPPTQVYADGEFVCETPIDVRVLRGALAALRPA